MIHSKLILDIFDLVLDDHKSEDLIRKQIQFLSISQLKHTGIGLFINFVADTQVEQYKDTSERGGYIDIDGNPFERIDGVEIRNAELDILADASLYLTNGIIDCLEIWNKIGDSYPTTEPDRYELHQMWLEEGKRRSIIR